MRRYSSGGSTFMKRNGSCGHMPHIQRFIGYLSAVHHHRISQTRLATSGALVGFPCESSHSSPLCTPVRGFTNSSSGDEGGASSFTGACPADNNEDQKRKEKKTQEFLTLVLTTPREQEWRDMLYAALRYRTFHEGHLISLIRGIRLNRYDSSAGASSSNSDSVSTPSKRLLRVLEAVKFVTEEAPVAQQCDGGVENEHNEEGGESTLNSSSESVYRPQQSSVHRLLVELVKASQECYIKKSSEDGGVPAVSPAHLWAFLAWMERHSYVVESSAVLDALELFVDVDNNNSNSSRDGAYTSSAAGSFSFRGASSSALQFATVSKRIHRLEFINNERERLAKASREGSSAPTRNSGRGGGKGPRPRVDPEGE